MNRIDLAFERLRREKMRGLIAYLTAGDPSPDRTVELVLALERGGADIIELGVPFSDPTADGPVIQRASDRALKAGTTFVKVLDMIRELRKRSQIPIVVFSYLNPILRYGFERFATDAAAAGADGALLTDLNVEAAEPYLSEMQSHDLMPVFLVSQTTSPDRLQQVAKASGGFLYLVSTAGVTGVRDTIASGALPLVERARAATDLPLALGFGLSKKEHMQAIAPYADAAIVGSAFMRVVEETQGALDLPQRLESLAAELKSGLAAQS
ncbi:MAG: tryptophan synthase subunit alpha [Acidobacteria bacterium]|nr:tryptophan synthase subunit alpha [Acidobacteriota bacterium]